MKSDNKLSKITGIRLTEKLDSQIETYCKKNDISKPDLLREIITDYFSVNNIKSLKALNRQVENYLPDFKHMHTEFRHMQSKLTEYVSESMEVHGYIAEMKSAESFYFRELKQMFETNQKLIYTLIEKLSGESAPKSQAVISETDEAQIEETKSPESTRDESEEQVQEDKPVIPCIDEHQVVAFDQTGPEQVLSTEDEEHQKVKHLLGL